MSENNKVEIDFINNVIIKKGIDENQDISEIKENIEKYKAYLTENGLLDEETEKAIEIIERKIVEYVDIAKDFSEAGLEMPSLIRDNKEKSSKRLSFIESLSNNRIEEKDSSSTCYSTRDRNHATDSYGISKTNVRAAEHAI